jgi:hypothetical protein
MPDLSIEQPRNPPATASRAIVVKRIRFVPHPLSGTRIRRTFRHPRPCLAVEQTIDLQDLPRQRALAEADTLYVVHVPPEAMAEWTRVGSNWMAPAADPESLEPVTVVVQGERIHWRPGRIVVEGKSGLSDELMSALAEFAFYEGEVRALEQSIETYETQARLDGPKTYRAQRRHRGEWARFNTIMEGLIQSRITFASLEPRIERGSRTLCKQGREVATKLFRAAATSSRMEGLDGRLEVCEELYEGAIDRIADYRGWHTGHILEVIIIVILLAEAGFMAIELILRLLGRLE